jgi:hypothetical protein
MTQAFNLSQLANKVNTSGQLDASTGLVNTTPAANGGTGKSTNTAGTLLLGNGTSALTELAGSVTNDIVSWSGSAWVAAPAGAAGAGGDYVMLTYVSPATYVKPATVRAIKVTVVGAGGNGGNAISPNLSGSPGAGGGAAIRYLDSPAIPSSPIAITAGGGTNSFGAFASATAGANGASPPTPIAADGGVGSSGDLNIGGNGGGSLTNSSGGSSIFGGGGAARGAGVTNAAGAAGRNYGGGGSGASRAPTGGSQTGGAGAPGVVIIEEFY